MSLYKDASLAMIPSAYKDGKLYSIRPTDGSGDFTFSRGSNLAATRVDVNGLIEKGRENILTYSNDFSDSDWAKTGISLVSGGQSGYDGSNDAYIITSNTSTTNHYLRQSASTQSGVQTYSIYAKGNGYDVQLRATGVGGTTNWVSFNLVSGSVGTSGAGIIESKMTSLGNGWYRCSAAFNDSGSPFIGIYMVEDADTAGSGPSYTGDGTSGIFLQDAQAEQGLVATDYIETGASTAQAGILEDMPRLDYSGGASCPSLLLEPQRQNLVTQSEYYGGSDYLRTRCGIVTNTSETLSPQGVYNASKMTSTDAAESYIQQSVSVTGTKMSLSFYAKSGDNDFAHGLVWDLSQGGTRQWFNLSTGEVGSTGDFGTGYSVVSGSAKIQNMGNGWYRCSFVVTCLSGSNGVRLNLSDVDGAVGSAVNSYGYFYGFQAEDASYPTSYIPTYGSSVTRSNEGANTTYDDLLTNGEGVVFIEFNTNDVTISGYPQVFQLFNPSASSDRFWCYIFNDSDSGEINFGYRLDINGARQSEGSFTIDTTTTAKIAMRLQKNNYAAFYNGVKDLPSGFDGVVNDMTKISFSSTPYPVGISFNQFLTFPTPLTDSEMVALTTL